MEKNNIYIYIVSNKRSKSKIRKLARAEDLEDLFRGVVS